MYWASYFTSPDVPLSIVDSLIIIVIITIIISQVRKVRLSNMGHLPAVVRPSVCKTRVWTPDFLILGILLSSTAA